MNSRNNVILIILGLIISLSASGCLEIKMNTRVNRDGSLVRTQRLTGDSSEVLTGKFPSVIDSSWTVTVSEVKAPEAEKGWERVAVKTFSDASELNAAMAAPSGLSLRLRASLEKRFLWFFTEYFYKETYLRFSPFNTIPLSKYVTQSEIDKFYRHEMNKERFASEADSLSMKDAGDRFMEWRSRNMFEAYYQELRAGVEALHDPALTTAMLDKNKEELFDQMKGLMLSTGNADTLMTVVARILRTPKVRAAVHENERGFASYWEKVAFVEDLSHSLQTSITMPGLIIDTNAPSVEGSTAAWKEIDSWAYFDDFEVWVKSRVVNWWAVGIAGIVVVGALVLLVVSLFRRRSRAVPAA